MGILKRGRPKAATSGSRRASPSNGADILDGYAEIGRFMRMSEMAAKHRALAGEIPTYQVGRRRYARKSTLLAWIEKMERENCHGIGR